MARRVIVVDDSDPRYWDPRYRGPSEIAADEDEDEDADEDEDEWNDDDDDEDYDDEDDDDFGGSWGGYPVARPRLAADGIRAASVRGAIGSTWWSKRFIATLEAFGHGGRLTRGRSYARSGQVLSLAVAPGRVRAEVQGSARKPYRVVLAVPVFAQADWRRFTTALATQAGYAAALLSGQMPTDIEKVCNSVGLSLFPSQRELGTECSCPDQGNPCKHAAATCYILAERFDADPFAMLAWRGLDREPLLTAIRASGNRADGNRAGGNRAARTPSDALADAAPDFWNGRNLPDLPAPPRDVDPGRILRQLGASGVTIAGTDLIDLLLPAYQAMTASRSPEDRIDELHDR